MKVRVHNLNTYDHVEKWRNQLITIPAGEYIMMEQSEAEEFFGTFYPMKRNENYLGGIDPRSFKKLKIEYPEGGIEFKEEFVNPLTGKKYDTKEALDASLVEHEDKVIKDPVAEEELMAELEAKARALGVRVDKDSAPKSGMKVTKGSQASA